MPACQQRARQREHLQAAKAALRKAAALLPVPQNGIDHAQPSITSFFQRGTVPKAVPTTSTATPDADIIDLRDDGVDGDVDQAADTSPPATNPTTVAQRKPSLFEIARAMVGPKVPVNKETQRRGRGKYVCWDNQSEAIAVQLWESTRLAIPAPPKSEVLRQLQAMPSYTKLTRSTFLTWLARAKRAPTADGRGRRTMLPDAVFEKIKEAIKTQVECHSKVTPDSMHPMIFGVIKAEGYGHLLFDKVTNPSGFKASPSWILRTFAKMKLSYRCATTAAQKLPAAAKRKQPEPESDSASESDSGMSEASQPSEYDSDE